MIQMVKMNALHDMANNLTAHTGLKAKPHGDDSVDIMLYDAPLGTLKAADGDASLFHYYSEDGYDVTGTYDDIEDAIHKDFENQIEYVEVTPDYFPPGTKFESVIWASVNDKTLRRALLDLYMNTHQ